MSPNPYILAADNPQALLELLREDPAIATSQDEHGYSLVHAAASYNHFDLLRSLINDYKAPVDIKDEDGETALFVVETVEAARILVEELKLDTKITNDEGQTAREKFEAEGEVPEVVEYLAGLEGAASSSNGTNNDTDPPPAPQGLKVTVGTMNEAEEQQPDPEFRRRIEELAARDNINTPEGQAALRQLVEEAISGEGLSEERSVRPRQE